MFAKCAASAVRAISSFSSSSLVSSQQRAPILHLRSTITRSSVSVSSSSWKLSWLFHFLSLFFLFLLQPKSSDDEVADTEKISGNGIHKHRRPQCTRTRPPLYFHQKQQEQHFCSYSSAKCRLSLTTLPLHKHHHHLPHHRTVVQPRHKDTRLQVWSEGLILWVLSRWARHRQLGTL